MRKGTTYNRARSDLDQSERAQWLQRDKVEREDCPNYRKCFNDAARRPGAGRVECDRCSGIPQAAMKG